VCAEFTTLKPHNKSLKQMETDVYLRVFVFLPFTVRAVSGCTASESSWKLVVSNCSVMLLNQPNSLVFFPPATSMGLRRDWVVLVITDEVVLGGNIYLMLCRDDMTRMLVSVVM